MLGGLFEDCLRENRVFIKRRRERLYEDLMKIWYGWKNISYSFLNLAT